MDPYRERLVNLIGDVIEEANGWLGGYSLAELILDALEAHGVRVNVTGTSDLLENKESD